jgi:peptide deformylase
MKLVEPFFVENAICKRVTLKDINENFFVTIKDMLRLCLDSGGVGLAAPQVGILLKFFVSLSLETKDFGLFINPEYESISAEQYEKEESCLTYGTENKYKVKRFNKIIAKWEEIDIHNQMLIERQKMMTGIDAQIFQHETDHVGNGQFDRSTTIAMIGEKIKNG